MYERTEIRILIFMFIALLIKIAKKGNKLNIYCWMGAEENAYVNIVHYSSALETKAILLYVMTWMNPETIILNEVSQSRKYKYYNAQSQRIPEWKGSCQGL